MKMHVHQIWLGGAMPKGDKLDTDDMRNRCAAGGHGYNLWDEDSLLAMVDGDLKAALAVMKEKLPFTMYASALTDYFRFYLLDTVGSVYMDTDVRCNFNGPSLPPMPTGADLFTCSERANPGNINTCVTYAATETGVAACRKARDKAEAKLTTRFAGMSGRALDGYVEYLKERPFSLSGLIGPGFFRKEVVPELDMEAVKTVRMPHRLCSSHDPASLLWHRGTGKWCFGGRGNNPQGRQEAYKASR